MRRLLASRGHAPLSALLFVAAAAPTAAQLPEAVRPDLLLFMVDDMGWRDPSFMGSGYHLTPHMDALAREGLVFTQAYAAAPNCAPSRGSVHTGTWTPEHGILTVGSPARGREGTRRLLVPDSRTTLEEGCWTVAEALREAGYHTVHVGKWHLSEDPTAFGFERNFAGGKWGHPPKGYQAPHGLPGTEDAPEGSWLTELEGQAAAEVLSSEEDRPLFLSWTPYAVHTPIQAPEGEVAAFRERLPDHGQGNARYAGMLASLDRQLGRALAAHRRLRGGRPLVTILTSDNGGLAPITSMEPLSGWKGMLREGGIRVPLVLHGGPFALEGESCPEPAHHVDLAPTLLALAGVSLPAGLRGRDLARRGALEERPLFWHFPCYLEGRGHAGDPWRARPGGALRLGRWKLLEDFESGQLQLFDLQEDPGEERDLAAAEPETVEDLHGRLVAWRSALGAPMPSGPDPAFVADPEPRARSGAR